MPEQAIRKGDELVAQAHYVEAVGSYRTALQAAPRNARLRLRLATALVLAGDSGAATEQAIRGADLLPDNTDAQLFAASLALTQTRFPEGRDRAAAVVRQHPDNVDALIIHGTGAALLTTPESALRELDQAMRTGIEYEGARANLRKPYYDDETAEKDLRKAVALAPRNLLAQLALANFLWAAGRPTDAEPLLKLVADFDIRFHHEPSADRVFGRLVSKFIARGRADATPAVSGALEQEHDRWPYLQFDVLFLSSRVLGTFVGSSRVDLQACKLEYSIVSPK